jgi:hypothetical protein
MAFVVLKYITLNTDLIEAIIPGFSETLHHEDTGCRVNMLSGKMHSSRLIRAKMLEKIREAKIKEANILNSNIPNDYV